MLKYINQDTVVVTTLDELVTALRNTQAKFITLPPNAILYMGLEHICAMLQVTYQRGIHDVYSRFILNVQDDAGLCLKAFKTQLQNFLFTGDMETLKKLDQIATQHGNKNLYA